MTEPHIRDDPTAHIDSGPTMTTNTTGSPMTDTVTVPREPTPQMVGAGWNAFLSKDGPSDVIDVYRAMLAAAPPSEPGEVEIDVPLARYEEVYRQAEAAEATADRLQAQVERLAEALRPFADAAGEWDGEPDSLHVELAAYDPPRISPGASVADFRRAREALASLSGDGDGWREITEDDQPALDTDWLLGWWEEQWQHREWKQQAGRYGNSKAGWRHGYATHYRPLPVPPLPTKEASNG